MAEKFEVRLARIEERLRYVATQLDKLLCETEGLRALKVEVMGQKSRLENIHDSISKAKGMVVAVSAVVAFIAAWLPEIILKKLY